MATWGGTTLNTVEGSYIPAYREALILEERVLAVPAFAGRASMLQQNPGHLAPEATFDVAMADRTGYDALLVDWNAGTQRAFVGRFTDSFTNGQISHISKAKPLEVGTWIIFTMTIKDVTP